MQLHTAKQLEADSSQYTLLISGMGGVSIYSKADVGLQEVEPYIPFNINPTGMQPVLTTTYLMAVPSLVA